MALEPDIVEKVHTDFGRKSDEALHLLRGSGKAGRVARCIVMASRGSLARLKKYIELARLDYRDAITAGEYDSGRVRDLRVSLPFGLTGKVLDRRGGMHDVLERLHAGIGGNPACAAATVRRHRRPPRGSCEVCWPRG